LVTGVLPKYCFLLRPDYTPATLLVPTAISKEGTYGNLLLPNYRSMYESEFIKLSASSLSNQGGVESHVPAGLPLPMEVPGVAWMATTEADLHGYAAMYLTKSERRPGPS
jgi:hypothetical protein